MTVHIIDEAPDVYLTQDQYNRLMAEYRLHHRTLARMARGVEGTHEK